MNLTEPVAEDPLLTVRDFHVGFESFDGFADVVDGVSLSVGKGEVVTIAGETGCGKSVTMKAILRLLSEPPARVDGDITFDGTNLRGLPRKEFDRLKGRRMSLVFQDPMSSLNPTFTIGEQLTDTAQFGGRSDTGVFEYARKRYLGNGRAKARERALEMLREVQMPDPESVMDSYPTQLSGGMCQRVLIAQALLNDPDLLIADEIGTALDVTIHDQILDLLKDLIDEHDLSVLMITHNLGVARQVSDRIYVMYGGRIVETAPTQELFDAPKHPYTQGLVASIPRLTGEPMAEGIDGSVPEYLDPPSGCRFHPRCPYAHDGCKETRPVMNPLADQSGVECVLYDETHDAPYERPTLEDTRNRMGTIADRTPSADELGVTEMGDPLLEVEDLEKYFPVKGGILKRTTGHVKAVDGVSFDIERGETMALIGESGSGKSTVAKTIIGLHNATGGSVRFDGEDITDPSDDQLSELRSRMQMVFQDPTSSLNPRRTIGNSLEVPMQARGVPADERQERISELLELVELNDEYLYKYPHELSGGQKQRINIARAISIEPDLLLLDEPTSALDVSVQAKIIGLLEDLQEELNLTYLFITHDLSLVRNFADETAVMYLGQIQEKGETKEVFHRPRHPYSRALLSAIPVTSEDEERYKPRREPLEGEIPSPRDIPTGCRFRTRCPYATEACSETEPAFTESDGGPLVRCHIYDEAHEDTFEEVPELTATATDGGTARAGDHENEQAGYEHKNP